MKTKCQHEFDCSVAVFMFEDNPGNASVELKGQCRHCSAPLIFQGPRGVGSTQAMASVDRIELRAPVTIGLDAVFKPGPEIRISGPELTATGREWN